MNLSDEVRSAIMVAHSGTRFVAGLAKPIPAYKYPNKEGCMIHLDFITFQSLSARLETCTAFADGDFVDTEPFDDEPLGCSSTGDPAANNELNAPNRNN